VIGPRISWHLSPKAKRKAGVLVILLAIVILIVSSNWFWRMLYPVNHEGLIREAAARTELDPLYVAALIRVESKFEEEGISHVGATGLMQLMPETAEWIAGQSGIPYRGQEDLALPETNIRLGAWYLGYLKQQFKGNLVAMTAAYNAGQGRVSRWISTGVWDGAFDTSDRIPVGETRHYVQRVFYTYDKYKKLYPDF